MMKGKRSFYSYANFLCKIASLNFKVHYVPKLYCDYVIAWY